MQMSETRKKAAKKSTRRTDAPKNPVAKSGSKAISHASVAKKRAVKASKNTEKKGAVVDNPVAKARHRAPSNGTGGKPTGDRSVPSRERARRAPSKSNDRGVQNLFLESRKQTRKGSGRKPTRNWGLLFGVLNVCLMTGIAVLLAMAVRQQAAYADFTQMRYVVDQQTFYDGTTIDGVDVSHMTLANAMDYWGERVESRYANRTVVLDNGQTITAGQLGYSSDYASVLSAAWSAGRSGTLEERYHMASNRSQNPVAYSITRSDYDEETLDQFVQMIAQQTDRPIREAGVESFDTNNYEFVFTEAESGRKLDEDALKRSIVSAIASGGGNVALDIQTLKPTLSTTEVVAQYGLIDYAITNASSSSKARLNNIKLAMSFINGFCLAPGETFSFNQTVGERTTERGFLKATAYSGGDVTEQVGGGICQVSTTLFNAAVKADMEILERHNHSLTVGYVDKGKDATVNWGNQDLKFRNNSSDNIYICCYLTDDKRVRFGMFGKLLPNGEKITLDAVTTEAIKFETQYIKTPLLLPGQTYVLQKGRTGYKAEAYKVRWDAQGNELSRELLCRSTYQAKEEIVQYGV